MRIKGLIGCMLGVLLMAMSCTKTTVETKTVDKLVHDTTVITPPPGPAFVRFISMVPGVNSLILLRNPDKSGSPFGGVLSSTGRSYIPIADSTPLTLYPDYFINNVEHIDSITLPGSLAPYSLTTFALFYVDDGQGTQGIYVKGNSDNAKIIAPTGDSCYIRFINGMQDYPSPTAELYLNLDSAQHSIFTEGSIPVPTLGGALTDYVTIPAGNHKITTTTPTGEELDSIWTVFTPGGYYTARVQGKRSDLSNHLYIDAE